MSLKRWGAKRDGNEAAIVKALKRVGASVARISEPGMPDLIIWFRGAITLMEVKQAKGRTTAAQDQRSLEGWPVVTARSEEAALRAIGAIQ